jgi:hypothetical protein
MIVGSSPLWKKYYCATFLNEIAYFNLLLTVTSDINDVLFTLFNPFFVPYFITINKHQNLYYSIQIANTTSGFRAKQTGYICEGRIYPTNVEPNILIVFQRIFMKLNIQIC